MANKGDHQCHTQVKSFKVYLEEPGHVLFEINKASKEVFVIFQRFLKDLHQSENLVRGAMTWTKTALSVTAVRPPV